LSARAVERQAHLLLDDQHPIVDVLVELVAREIGAHVWHELIEMLRRSR
jgi:hypothetical protein